MDALCGGAYRGYLAVVPGDFRHVMSFVDPEEMVGNDGSINLSHLRYFPRGCRPILKSTGDLRLHSLKKLPRGARLEAAGDIRLGDLLECPKQAELIAGKTLVLGPRVTKLGRGCKIKVGGNLYVSGLKRLPDWFDRSCIKGDVHFMTPEQGKMINFAKRYASTSHLWQV